MSGYYDFDFDFSAPEIGGDVASGVMGAVVGVVLLLALLVLAYAVVSYVLTAVSTYRIAKRRGIHSAWLAWIPIANYWLLGSIADQYQYVAQHKVTNRRRILLVLGIVYATLAIINSILQNSTGLAFAADAGMGNQIGMVAVTVLVSLIYAAVAITLMVFCFIAYYDLYRSCKPNNAVLFLVLSVVFSVTIPFFLIACSNSDEGMPPRREPQNPVQPAYIPVAPVEEPGTAAPWQSPAEETEIAEDSE